ncbi:MAG: DEAD/DEAH box helicase, partial [Candidatus Latescibacterota bacterium]
MSSAEALLSRVFGFQSFRPGQAEIVEAVAKGENILAIMPTGGGKSLCFQLPALMRDGV